MTVSKELLEMRNELKKKKPEFIRQDYQKTLRLKRHWRHPEGMHSKMRLKLRGNRRQPSIGFSSPSAVKNLTPLGYKIIIVHSVSQLAKINEPITIASDVGMKKRIEIAKKAKASKLILTHYSQRYKKTKPLLEEAKEDEVDLKVVSAFRSFDTQAQLKSSYRVTYGSGANAFSADQGYSEHQLGTTVDFTTESVGSTFSGFDRTPAYTWLLENAYRYGFILSYPPDNSYYQYEPWHWRFVGKKLARDLHRENMNFYDLDQREIDEYLGEIFE